MIDFELTEEQRALIDTVRRFTRERIIPVAAEADRTSEFPRAVFQDAWKIGLVNPTLPSEYGGPGLSDLESVLVTEELAYGCSGIQTTITANTSSDGLLPSRPELRIATPIAFGVAIPFCSLDVRDRMTD